MPQKSIVWLASYPKSGNTWMRLFLANYLLKRETPLPINEINKLGFGDSVPRHYASAAGRAVDPTNHQACLTLRPKVLQAIANSGAKVNFVKTHNARSRAFGTELVPTALTRGAIYIIRHPMDVALSYARHYAVTPEQALTAMDRADHVIAGDRAAVPQYLGIWAEHAKGWSMGRDFPTVTIRYEDMLSTPQDAFARALTHVGLTVDVERLERAIRFSAFDELKQQEEVTGFIEQSANGGAFFHSGGAGGWRGRIDPGAVAAFGKAHAKTLDHHGYTL
ncbi:MAG: sulfotransferase domain-containing protein [Pseudomonadota bacterium]